MLRNTRQRRAIGRVFGVNTPPLKPHEILHAAQKSVPELGIATIYRTLKTMVEDGVLTIVELPGGPPRYELADKDHHHFFHCRSCGEIFVVHKCITDFKKMTPKGFKLERHEVVLYGICKECSA